MKLISKEETLQDLLFYISREWPGVIANAHWKNDILYLDTLKVPVQNRNNKIASKIMKLACNYADAWNCDSMLNPTSMYGSDCKKLIRFYSKFGFSLKSLSPLIMIRYFKKVC